MAASKTKAAIEAARRTNEEMHTYAGRATVKFNDGKVAIVFRGGVSLEAEDLIRDHQFNISPSSARTEEVKLY